jgi:hypothetical protein
VGSGVDIPMIKPALQAATSLQLSTPEEPEMALAQGAALASANAPLFASSTAALAYALDYGTGAVGHRGYQTADQSKPGKDNVAYSAVADEDADADTGMAEQAADVSLESVPRRRPILLLGSSLAVIFISAVVALEIALAISIRPTVALRPNPNENLIVPAQQQRAPAQASVPPQIRMPSSIAPPRLLNAPAPAPIPRAVPAPVPVAPVPIPMAPVRAPAVERPMRGLVAPREHGAEPFRRGPFGGGRGWFGGPFGGHGFGGHGFGGFGHGFGGFGHR